MALPDDNITLQFTEIDLTKNSTTNIDIQKAKVNISDNNLKNNDTNAINFWNAFAIPGVLEFSTCFFFTKSVSYIFLNWLPKFISHKSIKY